MVVLNTALLALLIPTAVLARGISHEKLHKRHGHEEPKSVVGTSVSAPYPTSNNATNPSLPVASHGVVTKISTIDVVPVPVTKAAGESSPSESASPEGSGEHGSDGKKESHGDKAGKEGGKDSKAAGSPEECGPATVTVTASAKTVTVTAGAASSEAPSATPAAKPAEKAHTPTAPEKKPEQAASQQPKPETKSEAPKVAEKKVEQPKTEDKHEKPAEVEAPKSSPQEAAPKTSEAPKKTTTKKTSGGKKGILYADLAHANAMAGEISWGCNWDSSPIPAVGHASGQLAGGMEFVPQLWGPEDVHTSIWASNSKGAEYVMAFNEPNQPQGAGGCGPISPSDAIAPYEKFLKGNKDQGQKIISPCVSNDAHQWLDSFISGTSLKPDAVCFHWYGLSLKELQAVVETFAAIQSKYNIPELWLTEWALNVDIPTSDAKELLQWLDNESGVDRYAYNNVNLVKTPGVEAAYCH